MEQLQANMMILKTDINEIKVMHVKCKERQSGKCMYFKDYHLLSSEDIGNTLVANKKVTKAKKKAATRNLRKYRNCRKKAISSDEDITSSASDILDSLSNSVSEILDCIEVN
jgi:ABC-type ATPase involved in cell division